VTSGPGSTTDVTIALASNPAGVTLSCAGGLTVAAVAGLASFKGCTVSAAGSYALVATASGLDPGTSAIFSVGPPPPPVPLVFQGTLAAGPANTPLTPTVVVKIQDPADPAGGPVTSGDNATAPVTLALGTNPSGATLFCTSGLTVTAMAGIATFNGCRISAEANGYTLVATSPGLVQATSTAFNQTTAVPVAGLGLTSDTSAIVWGTGVTLTAHLDPSAATGAPASGRVLHFQSSKDGLTWGSVQDFPTSASGDVSINYRPVTNLYYRAVFDGAADLGGAVSQLARVSVRETISLRPDNGGATKVVPEDTRVTFTVTVRPARPDVKPGKVSVQVYRRVGSSWRLVQTISSQPSAAGQSQFVLDLGTVPTTLRLRAMAQPTAVNANSLWTPYVTYRVT
jgi:hypothetical protein